MSVREYRLIGKGLPRVDAGDKVTARTLYTDDLFVPGTLHGLILRSPLPHARILRIEASRARAIRGVKAVVTGEDTLEVKFGVISRSP